MPALKIDGRRVQGSREIARELDRLQPEPPLFPADPEQRAAVEEAERLGDEELQHPIRQILWWALQRDRSPLRSYSEGARLGIPIGLAVRTAAPIVALSRRASTRRPTRTCAPTSPPSPGCCSGSTTGSRPASSAARSSNAADFQIAPSIRLAMTLEDLRPLIEGRPAGELAKRVRPEYPGDVPPVLPAAWLEPLRGAAAAA